MNENNINEVKEEQCCSSILMIRPGCFRMNEETSINNYFQSNLSNLTSISIYQLACEEFDSFVNYLKSYNINIIIIQNDPEKDTPDAIFPNNWISFHFNGKVCLYPMFAINRRRERLENNKIKEIFYNNGYYINEIIDLSYYEERNQFLEGTGVLILDRPNKIAYCSLSPRANQEVLLDFCQQFNYQPIIFQAYQTVTIQETNNNQTTTIEKRLPIYHTNVLMALGETFVIICLSSIDNIDEKNILIESFKKTNKEIIEITEEQVAKFAGNMLQVKGGINHDIDYLIMSTTAYNSLNQDQIDKITNYCQILHHPLNVIEICGGGSARCMLAEVFLPKIK